LYLFESLQDPHILDDRTILFAMLGVQGVLMMKERKRLSGIEPSIME
jgi:hypothetical protein